MTNYKIKPSEDLYIENANNQFKEGNYESAKHSYAKAILEINEKLKKNSNNKVKVNYYKKRIDTCRRNIELCDKGGVEYVKKPNLEHRVETSGEDDDTNLESIVETIDTKKPRYDFKKVAGMNDLKENFYNSIIEPLAYPTKFDEAKNSTKKGYILYGPPGCGKTYIFEALVGELNRELKKQGKTEAVFIEADLSKINNHLVGKSEKILKAYFEKAATSSPAVLFFDELDALGGKRSGRSKHDDKLVDAFLKYFGMIEDKPVIIVGATNNPEALDSALVRTGRFGDKMLLVGAPDTEARTELMKIYTGKMKDLGLLDTKVDFNKLADMTEGYAASDFPVICDDVCDIAKTRCRREKAEEKVMMGDFEEAINNNSGSLIRWRDEKKNKMLNMNLYNHKSVVQLKSGIAEDYKDIIHAIFDLIPEEELVYEDGLLKAIRTDGQSLKEFPEFGEEGNEEEEEED